MEDIMKFRSYLKKALATGLIALGGFNSISQAKIFDKEFVEKLNDNKNFSLDQIIAELNKNVFNGRLVVKFDDKMDKEEQRIMLLTMYDLFKERPILGKFWKGYLDKFSGVGFGFFNCSPNDPYANIMRSVNNIPPLSDVGVGHFSAPEGFSIILENFDINKYKELASQFKDLIDCYADTCSLDRDEVAYKLGICYRASLVCAFSFVPGINEFLRSNRTLSMMPDNSNIFSIFECLWNGDENVKQYVILKPLATPSEVDELIKFGKKNKISGFNAKTSGVRSVMDSFFRSQLSENATSQNSGASSQADSGYGLVMTIFERYIEKLLRGKIVSMPNCNIF